MLKTSKRTAPQGRLILITLLLSVAALQFFFQNSHAVIRLWDNVTHSESPSPLLTHVYAVDSDSASLSALSPQAESPLRSETRTNAPSENALSDNKTRIAKSSAQKDILQPPENRVPQTSQEAQPSWIALYRNGSLEIPSVFNSNSEEEFSPPPNGDCGSSQEDSAEVNRRTPEYISKIMAAQNEQLQKFYRCELKINPDIKGYLDIRFTVVPEGTVSRVTLLRSTLGSRRVEQHVIRCIKNLNSFGKCDAKIGDKTYRQRYNFGCNAK